MIRNGLTYVFQGDGSQAHQLLLDLMNDNCSNPSIEHPGYNEYVLTGCDTETTIVARVVIKKDNFSSFRVWDILTWSTKNV